jgi:hypothetical protein
MCEIERGGLREGWTKTLKGMMKGEEEEGKEVEQACRN